jgi:hypothetical protein
MLIFLHSRQVCLGSCKWAFVEALDCEGRPETCGPWNGRCPQRTAYLEENELTEPKTRDELLMRSNGDFHPDRKARDPTSAEISREFERWRRLQRRTRDFGRER